MTEILTESFCERCGTRYTFETAAPRKSRLGRVRTLSKGFRNFVLSDETTFSEALADARSEEELAATAHQLDAFHKTFNFCLTCRQYTCGSCWNEAEGRCLTCAPIPGREEPAGFDAMAPDLAAAAFAANGHEELPGLEDSEWPDIDLPADRIARALDGMVTAEPETAREMVEAPELEAAEGIAAAALAAAQWNETLETVGTAESGLVAEEVVEPVAAIEAVEVVEAVEPSGALEEHAIAGVEPGQSLDDAIAAYEAQLAAEEAEVAAEIARSAQALAESADAAQAAEAGQREVEIEVTEPAEIAQVEAETLAAAAEPVQAPEPEPAPARDDVVAQPAWPVPPPRPADSPVPAPPPGQAPAPASPWLTVAPDVPLEPGQSPAPPQWPTRPQWPAASARDDVPRTFGGRPILPSADAAGLWAASSREVLGSQPAFPTAAPAPTAQPCVSCGLSLSANARFCRRCGSRQG